MTTTFDNNFHKDYDSQAGDERRKVESVVKGYGDLNDRWNTLDEVMQAVDNYAERRTTEARIAAELQGHRTTATVLQYVIEDEGRSPGGCLESAKHWKKQTDKLISALTKEIQSS